MHVYDPLVSTKLTTKSFKFHNKLNFKNKFDSVFFAVPHKAILDKFKNISKILNNNAIVFDLKSVLNKKKMRSDLSIFKF